jgi:hypothetical protein
MKVEEDCMHEVEESRRKPRNCSSPHSMLLIAKKRREEMLLGKVLERQ